MARDARGPRTPVRRLLEMTATSSKADASRSPSLRFLLRTGSDVGLYPTDPSRPAHCPSRSRAPCPGGVRACSAPGPDRGVARRRGVRRREAGSRAGGHGHEDHHHAHQGRARRREDLSRPALPQADRRRAQLHGLGRATPTRCSPSRSRTPAASRSTPPTWVRATTWSPSSAPAGRETIDLISPSSDAVTAIIEAGLASPLDLSRIPSYADLSEASGT